jgi:hypothetical protein
MVGEWSPVYVGPLNNRKLILSSISTSTTAIHAYDVVCSVHTSGHLFQMDATGMENADLRNIVISGIWYQVPCNLNLPFDIHTYLSESKWNVLNLFGRF